MAEDYGDVSEQTSTDIRTRLGLPADATDQQVDDAFSRLQNAALGNLKGPEGWTGIAQGNGKVVFEKSVDAFNFDFVEDFVDESIDMVSVKNVGDELVATVRIVRES